MSVTARPVGETVLAALAAAHLNLSSPWPASRCS